MAEEIVQLRKSEYDELVRTSKLNKKKVTEEARKLWTEKGAARLDISIRTKSDTYCTVGFDCTAYVRDTHPSFPISDKLRERLSKFLKEQIRYEVDEYYGEPLKIKNNYNKLVKSQNKWFRLAWLVALSGWAFAGAMLAFGG